MDGLYDGRFLLVVEDDNRILSPAGLNADNDMSVRASETLAEVAEHSARSVEQRGNEKIRRSRFPSP
jgi:hypothetical protein